MRAKFQHTDVFGKGCGYIDGVQTDPPLVSIQLTSNQHKARCTTEHIEACQRMNLLIIQLECTVSQSKTEIMVLIVCFLDLLLVCFSEYKHEKPI